MDELIFVLLFVLWYSLALIISEKYGKVQKPGVEWLFFISFTFSPIAGFILVKLTKNKQ